MRHRGPALCRAVFVGRFRRRRGRRRRRGSNRRPVFSEPLPAPRPADLTPPQAPPLPAPIRPPRRRRVRPIRAATGGSANPVRIAGSGGAMRRRAGFRGARWRAAPRLRRVCGLRHRYASPTGGGHSQDGRRVALAPPALLNCAMAGALADWLRRRAPGFWRSAQARSSY